MSNYHSKKARDIEFEIPITQECWIIVRYRYSEDGAQTESFSVSQMSFIFGVEKEVIRFDASEREPVNVHEFFVNRSKKRILNKPINYDTIKWCIENIQTNWFEYKQKYEVKGNKKLI